MPKATSKTRGTPSKPTMKFRAGGKDIDISVDDLWAAGTSGTNTPAADVKPRFTTKSIQISARDLMEAGGSGTSTGIAYMNDPIEVADGGIRVAVTCRRPHYDASELDYGKRNTIPPIFARRVSIIDPLRKKRATLDAGTSGTNTPVANTKPRFTTKSIQISARDLMEAGGSGISTGIGYMNDPIEVADGGIRAAITCRRRHCDTSELDYSKESTMPTIFARPVSITDPLRKKRPTLAAGTSGTNTAVADTKPRFTTKSIQISARDFLEAGGSGISTGTAYMNDPVEVAEGGIRAAITSRRRHCDASELDCSKRSTIPPIFVRPVSITDPLRKKRPTFAPGTKVRFIKISSCDPSKAGGSGTANKTTYINDKSQDPMAGSVICTIPPRRRSNVCQLGCSISSTIPTILTSTAATTKSLGEKRPTLTAVRKLKSTEKATTKAYVLPYKATILTSPSQPKADSDMSNLNILAEAIEKIQKLSEGNSSNKNDTEGRIKDTEDSNQPEGSEDHEESEE